MDREHVMRSFAELIRHWASVQPEMPAITVDDETWSYLELDRRSSRVAHGLLRYGVRPGDRVAYLGRNHLAYAALLLGASKTRSAMIALNARLTAPQLAEPLRDSRPAVVVVTPELLPVLRSALAHAAHRCAVVLTDDPPRGWPGFADWLAAQPPGDPGLTPAPEDIAVILYTSGTTGSPKGVILSVANFDSAFTRPLPWSMASGVTSLPAVPVYHLTGVGWIVFNTVHGGHLVMLSEPVPDKLLDALRRHRVTNVLLVPLVMETLLAHPALPGTDLSALRTVVYGGSPVSPDVLRRALEVFRCRFVQAYGLSEATGVLTYLLPEDHCPESSRLTSVGRPQEGIEMIVAGARTGEELPPGEVGEIRTRSGQNMVGYLNRPEETAAAITEDGWLRTGDSGSRDADGYYYIGDRISDMIACTEGDVYPTEVENLLASHPDVAEAAVIGVPHPGGGQAVRAVVVARTGARLDPDELIDFCRERLVAFKCPTSVVVVGALPYTAAGKLLRRQVRASHGA